VDTFFWLFFGWIGTQNKEIVFGFGGLFRRVFWWLSKLGGKQFFGGVQKRDEKILFFRCFLAFFSGRSSGLQHCEPFFLQKNIYFGSLSPAPAKCVYGKRCSVEDEKSLADGRNGASLFSLLKSLFVRLFSLNLWGNLQRSFSFFKSKKFRL
jgi:hypothetical protein